MQQIVRKHRSASAAYPHISNLYFLVIELLHKKVPVSELSREIRQSDKFKYVTLNDDSLEDITNPDFSRERKSEIFMKTALDSAVRCAICNGLLHKNSITIDHLERKRSGGLGTVENGQLAHPYCNTTYKN